MSFEGTRSSESPRVLSWFRLSRAAGLERRWKANTQAYGVANVLAPLDREGLPVARCTIEGSMRRKEGLKGVTRGKVVRTTISNSKAPCPAGKVNRQFLAEGPPWKPGRPWNSRRSNIRIRKLRDARTTRDVPHHDEVLQFFDRGCRDYRMAMMRLEPVQLLERDFAGQILQSALTDACAGYGCTVLVHGEAGIGKTSLVSRLANNRGDVRLLWGGCEALHSPRPLGPLHDMTNELPADMRAMFTEKKHPVELFARVLDALRGSAIPTLMVIEDLHWADAATLDLVKYLARRIERVSAMMVLTYRDDELGTHHPLRLLLGELPANSIVRVPLLPLSEEAVGRLAERAGRVSTGIFASTNGNPFFVNETLRTDGLPASVRDAVLARLARQSPGVSALLELVAITPTKLEIGSVQALLHFTEADLAAAIASGLLIAESHALRYKHDLARIAIEQSIPAHRASALHAKMLSHLEERISLEGNVVGLARLVHHAAHAGVSAAVLKYAPAAAEDAASLGAHREAAALYATALTHAFALPQIAQAHLLEGRAYQSYLNDDIEDAITARLSVLTVWRALGKQEQEGRTLRWLSRLYWVLARNPEAERYADQSLSLLERIPAGLELAWAMSNRSQLDMLQGRLDEAVEWGERAMALATRFDGSEVLAHAMNNVGSAKWEMGELDGRDLLEQSLQLALAGDYGEHISRAYANLTTFSVTTRDYERARRVIAEANDYFAARDLDVASKLVLSYECRLEFEQGRWEQAALLASRILKRHGSTPIGRIPVLILSARLRLRCGEAGAYELLGQATAVPLNSGELLRQAPVAVAHAEAAWLRFGHTPDVDALLAAYELMRQSNYPRSLGEFSAWLRRLDITHVAPSAVERPYQLQFEGRWEEAAGMWEQLGVPYEQALALLEGDADAMRKALTIFESLGAKAASKRCRENLRTAGVRGVGRGPRATTVRNPAGLTTRELEVLMLLATGMTNAEIAKRLARSEKTVDHHVAAVLRKLAVRSRSEAAIAANRLGLIS